MTAKKAGKDQAPKTGKLLKSGVSTDVGKATQFKPGQSGNPKGLAKGTKHLATHIQEMLNDENFEAWLMHPIKGYELQTGPPIKAIVTTALIRAMSGEDKSREWLAKYGYGTKVEVSTPDGQPPLALVQIVESGKPADS